MKRLAVLFCLSLVACGNPSAETQKERAAVESAVHNVLTALAERDFKALASFVGKEGLIVSPYVMLDQDDVRLSREEVERCASSPQVRLWGYGDGSSSPFEATCKSYFDKIVWNGDYRKAQEVLYNEPRQRGNEVNNNHDFVPAGIVVELHIRGEGTLAAFNWRSLRLIFCKGEQGLALVAITRDMWTI